MSFKSKVVAIATSDTDVFEMPATLQGAVVLGIGNANASARTVTLKFYDALLDATTIIVSGYSIAGNTPVKWPTPILMAAGDKIIMAASHASSIVAHASVTDSESSPVAIGLTPRGAWQNDITYNANDLVRVEDAISAGRGASFIAKPNASPNLNQAPTTETAFWMLYAGDGPEGSVGFDDLATTDGPGVVELATNAEAQAGSDAARAVTPAALAAAAIKQGVHTQWVPASAMEPRASSPAESVVYDSGSNDRTIRCLAFDATTQEYAQFCIAMPASWNGGTITFRPYWTCTGGSASQTVAWTLAARRYRDDDPLNTVTATAQSSADTRIANNDVHIGPVSSAITVGGTAGSGDLVCFEISRDVASDDLSVDALLIGVQIDMTFNAPTD